MRVSLLILTLILVQAELISRWPEPVHHLRTRWSIRLYSTTTTSPEAVVVRIDVLHEVSPGAPRGLGRLLGEEFSNSGQVFGRAEVFVSPAIIETNNNYRNIANNNYINNNKVRAPRIRSAHIPADLYFCGQS